MPPTRILIIDDVDAMRRLAVTVLALEGWDVLAARDAESGRAEIAKRMPDVILMDRDLPGMNGLDLTRALKADPRTRNIAILAFSSSESRDDDAQAIAAGSDGFVIKPINASALARTIAWHAATRAQQLGTRPAATAVNGANVFARPLGAPPAPAASARRGGPRLDRPFERGAH